MAFKPGFDQSPAFNNQGPNTWGGRGAGQQQAGWGQTPQQAQGGMTPDQLQHMYDRPAASTVDTDRMSYEDTIVKTLLAFGVLVVGAVAGWNLPPIVWIIGAVVGFVLALVNTFKKKPSPGLVLAYSFAQGLFVGGISGVYNSMWGGIVTQAVFGTLAVFAITLALFSSGKVRATPKATRFFLIAMVGYMAFSLVNLVLMWTGVTDTAFGALGIELFGIPLGVLIGIFVVIMAAYSLILDFDQIQTGVRRGAPRIYAWTAAFGLIVTLVWLYLEILRILAIIASSQRN
ncbi:putative YccA/Bax inhibitor family protein [Curtobacterium flaccumfaciens]|uniref:Putative YccA/Bax inhibitor family protein n=1 Tax=Curtobacterium flaccumfaciens TaxID=2035 RepID=A0A4R6DLA4_9MICO|nr:Bax inhibitor-1/YccA family protein [Curtobacterium flaccumfaciens]TDN45214.1 putative YccA/Bax inhibitor family protein [Curtobacterium flaccumfaciens]